MSATITIVGRAPELARPGDLIQLCDGCGCELRLTAECQRLREDLGCRVFCWPCSRDVRFRYVTGGKRDSE